jgi:hypothetical protein
MVKLKLYGRKVTDEQVSLEAYNLTHGLGKKPYPLSARETAEFLGIAYKTVYKYLHKTQIPRSYSGRLILPKIPPVKRYKTFNRYHAITSDPLVSEWIDDLITRKSGEPLKSWKSRVTSVEAVCKICNVKPSDLIVSQRNTEKIMRTFAQLYQQRDIRDPYGEKVKGVKNIIYARVQGVRSFCGYHGITWHRGVSGIMSQKIIGHGMFSDIRLTQDELDMADLFIKEKWGIDSDVYRWFWIGIESCARFGALFTMKNEYTKFQKKGKPIYIMSVYESKTDHIRGGKWTKYITRKDTQTSIDLLKQRGCDRIIESTGPRYIFQKNIREKLTRIYQHIGKNEEYFFHRPTHVLRHIGAHYWLSKTNYNYGIIAEVGGWNTIDELKKSYGQIPPEKILEMIE